MKKTKEHQGLVVDNEVIAFQIWTMKLLFQLPTA